jgi:hypothetical protein
MAATIPTKCRQNVTANTALGADRRAILGRFVMHVD